MICSILIAGCHAIKALPEKEKILSIPFMTPDGRVKPTHTKFIGITTREGDQKVFVIANKVAADWEKQLIEIPGFSALRCM